MKKLINDVDTIISESLDGFVAAHGDIVTLGADHKFIRRKKLKQGKVALISGGGSGHEPLHAGFVGHGMLDAACPGQIFTSPTPDQMAAAALAVDTGAGVLYIVKNYEGDVMNFEMAAELAQRPHRACSDLRRCRCRDLDLLDGSARRRGHAGGRKDAGCCGRARERSRRLPCIGRSRKSSYALNRSSAHELHGARGRHADLQDR